MLARNLIRRLFVALFGLLIGFLVLVLSKYLAKADEVQKPPASSGPDTSYVAASEQLIVELYVRDVKQSTVLFNELGFRTVRTDKDFVELGWEESRLYLEQVPGQPAPPATIVANVRIMVPDVDRFWQKCQQMKLPVRSPIADRYYGLRDFTVVVPDGIGLRFASKLKAKPQP